MIQGVGALQRALEMAKSGEIGSLTDLKAKLRAEGYGNEANVLFGKGIKMQLFNLIRAAKKSNSPVD